MTEKSENIRQVTRAEAEAAIREWATSKNLAALDAMTDEDIAAQIASNPDAAPELDDAWFEKARLVIPLKGRNAAVSRQSASIAIISPRSRPRMIARQAHHQAKRERLISSRKRG
jgi:hypothetical protein